MPSTAPQQSGMRLQAGTPIDCTTLVPVSLQERSAGREARAAISP